MNKCHTPRYGPRTRQARLGHALSLASSGRLWGRVISPSGRQGASPCSPCVFRHPLSPCLESSASGPLPLTLPGAIGRHRLWEAFPESLAEILFPPVLLHIASTPLTALIKPNSITYVYAPLPAAPTPRP